MSRRRTVLRGSELDDLPETVASRSASQIIEIHCCLCQIASPWGSHTSQPHLFASIVAVSKLEALKIRTKLNHFALRAKLYLKATRIAFDELRVLRASA